jgi:hypothetical protein
MDLLDNYRQKTGDSSGTHRAPAGGFTEGETTAVLLAWMPASAAECGEVVWKKSGLNGISTRK